MCFTGVLPCQCCNTGFCNNGRIKYKVSDTKKRTVSVWKVGGSHCFSPAYFPLRTKIQKNLDSLLKFSDKLGRIGSREFVNFLTNTIKVYF